jgi:hypothetical protein
MDSKTALRSTLAPLCRLTLGALILSAAALTAGCGGGSGSSASSLLPPDPPPATMATASGKVVDYTFGNALSDVPVAIATWAPNAVPTQIATTASDGSFSFTTAPGTYEMRIGSGSASDTRATLTTQIVLKAGSNPLVVPAPPTQQYVTANTAQLSGNFRLKLLDSYETACLNAANTAFQSYGDGPYADDEYALEAALWANQQNWYDQKNGTTPSGTMFFASQDPGFPNMVTALGEPVGTFNVQTAAVPINTPQSTAASVVSSSIATFEANTYKPERYAVACAPGLQGEVMLGIAGSP